MKQQRFYSKYGSGSFRDFVVRWNNQTVEDAYEPITGYGWKDTFAFRPTGASLYIDSDGNEYSGFWFEIDDTRIAIYEK